MVVTLAVIVATLVGHRLVARARLAAQVAPAPSAPVLPVIAAIHLDQAANPVCDQLDAPAQTLLVYRGSCGGLINPKSSAQPASVALYDSVTGAQRHVVTLPGASGQAGAGFVVGPGAHGEMYVVQSGSVSLLDPATGAISHLYSLDLGQRTVTSAALNAGANTLYLALDDGSLRAVDAATGAVLATASSPGGQASTPSGMALDASAGLLYSYSTQAAPADHTVKVQAYHLADLSPAGSVTLPQDWQPGPYDAAQGLLYCFGPNQTVGAVHLPSVIANQSGQTVQPAPVAALHGASRIGWDAPGGLLLRMDAQNTDLLRASDGHVVARAPLVGAATIDAQPIAVDAARGLAYFNDGAGDIIIASLKPMLGTAAPNAATAVVMARAGMARLLPDTNQNPPFLSAQTFPLAAGTVARQYFIHYADLGWKGPYDGSASVTDVRAGSQSGDYTMTFSVTWNQLFLHQHSWQVELTPDGRTHLRAESGDAIP